MKKAFRLLVVVLLLTFIAGSFAENSFAQSPVRKLGRGLANTFFGFLEFPRNIVDVAEEDGALASITYGFAKGLAMSFLRTGIGVYETVTFLIPLPFRYEPILEPEFMMGEENY